MTDEFRSPEDAVIEGARMTWVRLTGADTRVIASAILPHIFEPFFTPRDIGEGTCLGLSVSWGLVRDQGGWLAAESLPGKGSTFCVYLPGEPPRPVEGDVERPSP